MTPRFLIRNFGGGSRYIGTGRGKGVAEPPRLWLAGVSESPMKYVLRGFPWAACSSATAATFTRMRTNAALSRSGATKPQA
jgi:hypothetical protein